MSQRTQALVEMAERTSPSPRRRRWLTNGQRLLGLGIAMLAVMVIVTTFAPLLAPFDPSKTSPHSLAAPSAQHWLGTDSIGRDVLSRLIVGGRTTFLITAVAVSLALAAGLVLGLLSGYLGGIVDEIIMRILDIVFAFPVEPWRAPQTRSVHWRLREV